MNMFFQSISGYQSCIFSWHIFLPFPTLEHLSQVSIMGSVTIKFQIARRMTTPPLKSCCKIYCLNPLNSFKNCKRLCKTFKVSFVSTYRKIMIMLSLVSLRAIYLKTMKLMVALYIESSIKRSTLIFKIIKTLKN